MQYKNPKNRQLVKEALQKTNRGDLIGDDARCLLKIAAAHGYQKRRGSLPGLRNVVKGGKGGCKCLIKKYCS